MMAFSSGVCASHYMVLLLWVVILSSLPQPQGYALPPEYDRVCYEVKSSESYTDPNLFDASFYGIIKVAAGSSLNPYNASDIVLLRKLGLVRGDSSAVTTFSSHLALCLYDGLGNGNFHEFECSEANVQDMLEEWEATNYSHRLSAFRDLPIKNPKVICKRFKRHPDPQEKNYGSWKVITLTMPDDDDDDNIKYNSFSS